MHQGLFTVAEHGQRSVAEAKLRKDRDPRRWQVLLDGGKARRRKGQVAIRKQARAGQRRSLRVEQTGCEVDRARLAAAELLFELFATISRARGREAGRRARAKIRGELFARLRGRSEAACAAITAASAGAAPRAARARPSPAPRGCAPDRSRRTARSRRAGGPGADSSAGETTAAGRCEAASATTGRAPAAAPAGPLPPSVTAGLVPPLPSEPPVPLDRGAFVELLHPPPSRTAHPSAIGDIDRRVLTIRAFSMRSP